MTSKVTPQPIQVAFTRIFSEDKIVRNRMLNLLGCQVFRVIVAETLVRLRRLRLCGRMSSEALALLRDGIVVIPQFLDESDFIAVVEEGQHAEQDFFKQQAEPDKFGIARQKISIRKCPERFPEAIRTMLGCAKLINVVKASEGWSSRDSFTNKDTALTYERIEQLLDPGLPVVDHVLDASPGDLHTDTFHTVTKAFLTLNDITLENSPYTYVFGSNRLSLRRLVWEYHNSIRPEQIISPNYLNRVWPDEQIKLGVNDKQIKVNSNSLIITNTFGLHHRGSMTRKGAVRKMLRLDFLRY